MDSIARHPRMTLPDDESPRPDPLVQWWYWTGALTGSSGRRYGFQQVYFAVRSPLGGFVQNLQSGLCLPDTQQFPHQQTTFLSPQPGGEGPPGSFQLGDTSLGHRATGGDGHAQLLATVEGWVLELEVEPAGPPVEHYEGRLHEYRFFGNTWYYSRPRLSVRGTVRGPDGQVEAVSGVAWFDRQWGELLPSVLKGWQWFAFHFDDGCSAMLYGYDDAVEEWVGAWIEADGRSSPLTRRQFQITVDSWRTDTGDLKFPASWTVEIHGEVYRVQPWFTGQVMTSPTWVGPRYWEGLCTVTGPRTGTATAELVGFRHQIRHLERTETTSPGIRWQNFSDRRPRALYAETWNFYLLDPAHGRVARLHLSVVNPNGALGTGQGVTRLTVVDGALRRSWREIVARSTCEGDPDGPRLRVGGYHLDPVGPSLHLVGGTGDGAAKLDLTLTSVLPPRLSAAVAPGRLRWEWMSVLVSIPSGTVSGTITVDGRALSADTATVHHDHTWGVRNWGFLRQIRAMFADAAQGLAGMIVLDWTCVISRCFLVFHGLNFVAAPHAIRIVRLDRSRWRLWQVPAYLEVVAVDQSGLYEIEVCWALTDPLPSPAGPFLELDYTTTFDVHLRTLPDRTELTHLRSTGASVVRVPWVEPIWPAAPPLTQADVDKGPL